MCGTINYIVRIVREIAKHPGVEINAETAETYVFVVYQIYDLLEENTLASLYNSRNSNLRSLLPLLTLCQLHILLPIHHLQRLGLV
jgi:hypothetical protein